MCAGIASGNLDYDGERGFWSEGEDAQSIMDEFPVLFFPNVSPVRSPSYRCAPPKLDIFRGVVNALMYQRLVRPTKATYASPAFVVPNGEDAFRMVVDYRKVNSKIVFDSYPRRTIDQAFEQIDGGVILWYSTRTLVITKSLYQ